MWQLIFVSIGLGFGLAMDACAVSISNGLADPQMKRGRAALMAGIFGLFQGVMPMLGWLCVTLVVEQFAVLERWIPYIALALLVLVGGKMLYDGFGPSEQQSSGVRRLTIAMLLVQAVATSIDALSAGFSLADIAGDVWWMALASACIIAAVTFGVCFGSVYLGKKFGARLGNKAQILGGCILLAIGIEIFVSGIFF